MPYDPAKPASNTNASSAEMRAQLAALNADIQSRATSADLSAHITDTPHNCAGVMTLGEQGVTFSDPENQQLAAKIDELISTLRRT